MPSPLAPWQVAQAGIPRSGALVEQVLAFGSKREILVSPGRRRLRCIVAGNAVDDRVIKCRRDAPHEIMRVLFGSRSFPKCLDLILQVRTILRGKDGKFGRGADASRPVTGRAKVDRLFFRRLLNRRVALSDGRSREACQMAPAIARLSASLPPPYWRHQPYCRGAIVAPNCHLHQAFRTPPIRRRTVCCCRVRCARCHRNWSTRH